MTRPKMKKDVKIKEKKKDIPEYVQMFDRGDWESLDNILRTNIKYPKVEERTDCVKRLEDNHNTKICESDKLREDFTDSLEMIFEETRDNQDSAQCLENLKQENYSQISDRQNLQTDCTSMDALQIVRKDCINIDCSEITVGEIIQNQKSSQSLEDLEVRNAKKRRKIKKKCKQIDEKEKKEEEDKVQISLTSASKYSDGRRRRDKLHCCKFCRKLITMIGRHILSVHKEETEVAFILSLTNEERRKELLQQIEREGDYHYNKEVIAKGSGKLILVRRPTAADLKTHTYADYRPCTHCLGFLLKRHLWHHVKFGCKAKIQGEVKKVTRILPAIDRGKTNRFIEKKLDDINLDEMSDVKEDEELVKRLETEVDAVDDEQSDESEDERMLKKDRKKQCFSNIADLDSDYIPDGNSDSEPEIKLKKKKSRTKIVQRKIVKKPWTPAHKAAVLEFFRETISRRDGVHKVDADACIAKHSELQDRTWLNVRDFVRNHVRKMSNPKSKRIV